MIIDRRDARGPDRIAVLNDLRIRGERAPRCGDGARPMCAQEARSGDDATESDDRQHARVATHPLPTIHVGRRITSIRSAVALVQTAKPASQRGETL